MYIPLAHQVQFSVWRKRKQFNRPVSFSEGTALESVEIASVPEPEGETPLVRLEMEAGVQAVEETREVSCQTERWAWPTHTTILFELSHFLCRAMKMCVSGLWLSRSVPCNAVVQYEPRTVSDSEAQSLMEGEEMAVFLQEVCPR